MNAPRSTSLSFPRADRETAGFSVDKLAAIDAHYGDRVSRGEIAGIVYAVARGGELVHANAVGYAKVDERAPLSLDTVFRLYSMTKPVSAVALMMLYDEGRFGLDEPVSTYLPEFAEISVFPSSEFFCASEAPDVETAPAAQPITIKHVLTHTAGLPLGLGVGGRSEKMLGELELYRRDETLADQMKKVAGVPLAAQPGTMWSYSLSSDIQARLVEVLSGVTFDRFLQGRLFEPLGMKDTAFALRPDMVQRLADVHWRDGDRLVRWWSENLPPLPPGVPRWPKVMAELDDVCASYVRGAFGLFSTLDDYLRFAQMLLNRGQFAGRRFLSAETMYLMSRDHIGDLPMMWPVQGLGFGLGFAVIKDPAKTGFLGTTGTYYWDGAAATVFWVDPVEDLVVVGLTQHLQVPGIDPHLLGAELHNLVYAALDVRREASASLSGAP